MKKLPFEAGIFWKVLPTVYVLVVVAWVLIVRFTDYEMKPADYGGSFISATIFGYLLHLWMLPGEFEEEPGDWEDEPDGPESEDEADA